MKLLLLKTLLQRRAKDEGFTLPMVIALGLVMVLLGVISLTTANEENITAISQGSRSDALAIAEVGVARFRELLDRNRELTIFDDSQWATRRARTEVCNKVDRDIGSFLLGGSQNVEEETQDLNNDGDTDDVIGTYSLVLYDYSNADGIFYRTDDNLNQDAAGNDAKGTLIVQGTAADNSGKAQIQVEIPLRINREDLNNLAPALWIGNNTVTAAQFGNLTIGNDSDSEKDIDDDKDFNNDDGNIVIKDQATSTTDGCRSFNSLATPNRPVISNSRNLPSIQKIIEDVTRARNEGVINDPGDPIVIDVIPETPRTPSTSTPLETEILFGAVSHDAFNPEPKPGKSSTDCSDLTLCRYYYDFPVAGNLTYTNQDLLTDGTAKTTLLLNRPLTINATATTDGIDRKMKIGTTSNIADLDDSNAFEIYVNGANDITINAAGGQTITINAFIHAPESKLTITGGGTVNINGAVWVNDFVNNGARVNISPDLIVREPTPADPSTSVRAYKVYSTTDEFYGGTPEMTNRPLTGSPTNWKTEEVN